jgi:hypothetical protein
MNVLVLKTEFPSSAWRRAFAAALIRLRPDLNPDVADELSDSAFLSLADLEPSSAATLYSQGSNGNPCTRMSGDMGVQGQAG